MDSLVIPGRTRYPTDLAVEEEEPLSVDCNIARTLLTLDGQLHSRHVSTQSSVPSTASSTRDTTRFVRAYNDLAKLYALRELNSLCEPHYEKVEKPAQTPKPPPSGKRGLWRKLVRSTSSHNLPDPPRLVRKASFSNLLGKQPRLSLKCQSLDDFSFYGGVSFLTLPAPYRAFDLEIPTCLAATGNYLAEHGKGTAGIFRIPGQISIVTALHHYYTNQIYEACQTREQIHANIGSTYLPSDIICGIHDVASTFKKFLWDLPGGVLGSIDLFQALQDVQLKGCDQDIQARLCALAILSLMSSRRIAIICAVFGLLALIKHDPDATICSPSTPSKHPGSESMSSKALSLIFAPTLLGNMSEHIALRGASNQGTYEALQANSDPPRRAFKSAFRTPKHRKSNSTDRTPEIDASIQRNSAAAAITEMLVRGWEDIAMQIRTLVPRGDSLHSNHSFHRFVESSPKSGACDFVKNHASARTTSTGTSRHFLQVPTIARSISLIEMPQPSSSEDAGCLPIFDMAPSQNIFARYPKLISGTPQRGYSKLDSQETLDENLPWWSRRSDDALRLAARPGSSQDDELRLASDSTTLFTPSRARNSKASTESSTHGLSPLTSCSNLANSTEVMQDSNIAETGKDMAASACSQELSSYGYRKPKFGGAEMRGSENSTEALTDSGIKLSYYQDKNSLAQKSRLTRNLAKCQASLQDKAPTFGLSQKTPTPRSNAANHKSNNEHTSNEYFKSSSTGNIVPNLTGKSPQTAYRQNEQARIGNMTSLYMSPSLIPRPVAEFGRNRCSFNGSPRTKASERDTRQSGMRAEHDSEAAPVHHRMKNNSSNFTPLHLMPQQNQRHHIKTEPLPRPRNPSSLHPQGLRGEPVARQLHFGNNALHSRESTRKQAYDSCSSERVPHRQHSTNVGTLYAEIRVLSDRLNQAQREIAEWRQRAEWAESSLQGIRDNAQQRHIYQY